MNQTKPRRRRPRVVEPQHVTRLRLPKSLWERLVKAAHAEDRSVTAYVVRVLEAALDGR